MICTLNAHSTGGGCSRNCSRSVSRRRRAETCGDQRLKLPAIGTLCPRDVKSATTRTEFLVGTSGFRAGAPRANAPRFGGSAGATAARRPSPRSVSTVGGNINSRNEKDFIAGTADVRSGFGETQDGLDCAQSRGGSAEFRRAGRVSKEECRAGASALARIDPGLLARSGPP